MNIRTSKRHRRKPELRPGDRVRINGAVGCDHWDGHNLDFRGDGATVDAGDPHYRRADGERMVALRTDDGSFIAAPARALERDR